MGSRERSIYQRKFQFKKIQAFTLHPEIEQRVIKWFNSVRNHGVQVRRQGIQLEALRISREFGNREFKASRSWFVGFKQRNNLALRKNNDKSAKELKVIAELCQDYQSVLAVKVVKYEPNQIINYDETRFELEVKSQYAYDYKGATRIKGITTTRMNKSVTVVSMVGADGKNILQ